MLRMLRAQVTQDAKQHLKDIDMSEEERAIVLMISKGYTLSLIHI